MDKPFDALFVENEGAEIRSRFRSITVAELPDYEVLVEVNFSSLNYKDGLAITGKGRIARRLPMVAGIDLAGTIVESRSAEWQPGDRVVVNGWGMSETEWGGYSRFQRVKSQWLMRLPTAFSLDQAMAIGTAGYTAALCIDALERWGASAGDKDILVTGAAGGVGSVAVALLASRGYSITASTGRPEAHRYLERLGATSFVDRSSLSEKGGALQKERWAAAIDTVGSTTLANVLAQTAYGGAVAACGLAGGADLPATVMPHILRGVALLGVDSVMAPHSLRQRAWTMLSESLDVATLAEMTTIVPFRNLPEMAGEILAGRTRGRVVVQVE